MKLFSVILFFMLLTLPSCGQENTELSVDEVHSVMKDTGNVLLIDVRSPAEYNGPLGHVQGSVLIPLDKLQDQLPELEGQKDKEIILICRSGNRSGIATRILTQNGFKAANMIGGMRAWNERFPESIEVHKEAADTVK